MRHGLHDTARNSQPSEMGVATGGALTLGPGVWRTVRTSLRHCGKYRVENFYPVQLKTYTGVPHISVTY